MASTVLFFLVLYLHDRVLEGFRQLLVLEALMATDPIGIVSLAYASAVR